VTTHRHGIVLARPLLRSAVLAGGGAAAFLLPWPAEVAGAALLAAAALGAVAAVARWDRTHVVVGKESVSIEYGLFRRNHATVELEPGRAIEVERSLLGRLLGYGTVVVGELEIRAVPRGVATTLQRPR
jgi:hypothetical protein